MAQKSTESQCSKIKAALLRGEAITPLDALRQFGSFRLGARIKDLKDKFDMRIESVSPLAAMTLGVIDRQRFEAIDNNQVAVYFMRPESITLYKQVHNMAV